MFSDNFVEVWNGVAYRNMAVLDSEVSLEFTVRANHVDK